jgi:hypothetical protein
MNFDELANMIKNIKKEKGEDCLICHFPISQNKDLVKLNCNHNYHKSCLQPNKIHIMCPYCNRTNKLVTNFKSNNKCTSKIKTGINKGTICKRINCKLHKSINIQQELDICNKILKTGKNKGSSCGRIKCKIHNNEIIV